MLRLRKLFNLNIFSLSHKNYFKVLKLLPLKKKKIIILEGLDSFQQN